MFGWSEFTVEPEFELYLNDPIATDEMSATLLELWARPAPPSGRPIWWTTLIWRCRSPCSRSTFNFHSGWLFVV